MSEQNKKVFISKFFTDSDKDEDTVCLYDANQITGAKDKTFDIKRIANSEESPMIACKIHINNKTGKVFGVEFGLKSDKKSAYVAEDIKKIVNSTEFIKGKDYGRDRIPQIISTTMGNFTIKDKLRFIPPSINANAKDMSRWVLELVYNNKNVTGLQCFRWGVQGKGHVGLLAIDADKLRAGEKDSVAFFDSQGTFQDTFSKFTQMGYGNGETTISGNEGVNSESFLSKLKEQIDGEEKLDEAYIETCKKALTSIFGEIAQFIDRFDEGKACPVNIEKLTSGLGQKANETDCSYWVETFYTIICKEPEWFPDLEKFKTFINDDNKFKSVNSTKETLKESAGKARTLGLSEEPEDYTKRTTQSGISVTEQPKKPSFFSQVQDESDNLPTITLKTLEESKKVFKDIELIKITPKEIKENQLSSSELIEQIEQNGFTKEMLDDNNITIKRKGVNHFEPMGQFLSKNINKVITGVDSKKQSREI